MDAYGSLAKGDGLVQCGWPPFTSGEPAEHTLRLPKAGNLPGG